MIVIQLKKPNYMFSRIQIELRLMKMTYIHLDSWSFKIGLEILEK